MVPLCLFGDALTGLVLLKLKHFHLLVFLVLWRLSLHHFLGPLDSRIVLLCVYIDYRRGNIICTEEEAFKALE